MRRFRFTKKQILIAVVLLLLAAFVFLLGNGSEDSTATKSSDTNKTTSASEPRAIRLLATGDMLPHDTVNQQALRGGAYDYTGMFSEVRRYLAGGDIVFCNQESPSAASMPVDGYPAFNAPAAFARDLRNVGCNLINLGNNHTNDKGQDGINQTRNFWDTQDALAVIGSARSETEQSQPVTFTRSGVSFAALSYTACSNNRNLTSYGVNMLDEPLVDRQLAQVTDKTDIVIVSTHWCNENSNKETSTQRRWAEYFAAKNVDVVIGTGPHVLQPIQKLPKQDGTGDTVVWYSLGNFLNSQEGINGLIGGIAYMDIEPASKQITKLGFLPVYMHYEWTAAEARAGNLLARKNLKLYPLDKAESALSRSLFTTSVEDQTAKVQAIMQTYTSDVELLTSTTAPRD